MKKWFSVLLVMILTISLSCAAAEDEGASMLLNGDWQYIGYTYGGITFAVPKDYMDFGVSEADAARGCIIIGGNMDYTLQLRVFQPEELNYEVFKAVILQQESADWSVRMDGDLEILTYRNTSPSAVSELYGIAMTGLDGRLYKISIFTGSDEAFGEDAPVWGIAGTIGKSARHQDFSEWGLNEPNPPAGE